MTPQPNQAGRTYLERHFESFAELPLDELIKHALLALRETLATGSDLTAQNVAVGYVGLEGGFTILEDDAIAPHLETIKEAAPAAMDDTPAEGGAMDTA